MAMGEWPLRLTCCVTRSGVRHEQMSQIAGLLRDLCPRYRNLARIYSLPSYGGKDRVFRGQIYNCSLTEGQTGCCTCTLYFAYL